MRTTEKANLVIARLSAKEPLSSVREDISTNPAEWARISAKAYALYLESARKKRDADMIRQHVSATSNEMIAEITLYMGVLKQTASGTTAEAILLK